MGMVDSGARILGKIATFTRIGTRSFGFVDTNPVPRRWEHVTKIDPEGAKKLPLLFPLYLQHTSAVSVGGSRDVTTRNTEETFELIGHADVPVFHEPSAPRHITERTWKLSEFTAIPEVLNGDSASLVGKLGAAIENIRGEVVPELIVDGAPWFPWPRHASLADFVSGWLLEHAVFEAYIIQNADSAAAREAGVDADGLLDPADAARRALAAEKHLGSEVIYLEYSGTYGGDEAVDILEAIGDAVSWPRIWYGGGLASREDANRVLAAGADAVIVGNAFHDVAEEERRLCALAAEELDPGASRSAVREWLAAAVDVAESDAARYLSTAPSVADPAATAERYLEASVRLWLALDGLAADAGDLEGSEAVAGVAASCDVSALPAADLLGRNAGAEALLREYVRAHLADRNGCPAGEFPADHVGAIGGR